MFFDNLATFINDAAVNAAAGGPTAIGDQIDLRDLGGDYASNLGYNRDLGLAPLPLWCYIAVGTTAFNATTTGSVVTLQLVTASNEALTSDVDILWTNGGVTVTDTGTPYTAGLKLAQFILPSIDPTYQRYLGLRRTVATQTLTSGTLTAFLTPSPKAWRAVEANTGI